MLSAYKLHKISLDMVTFPSFENILCQVGFMFFCLQLGSSDTIAPSFYNYQGLRNAQDGWPCRRRSRPVEDFGGTHFFNFVGA